MSSNCATKEQPETCTLVVDSFSSCTTKEKWFNYPNSPFGLCLNADIDMSITKYWKSENVSVSVFSSEPKQVQYRMSIVNAKGQKCNTQEGKINFTENRKFGGQYIIFKNELLDTSMGWLVNDTLTVYCEVYVIDSELDNDSTPSDESIKASSMSHDYGSLFESGKLSDAVLVAGATEFKVHKAILGARSAVFGAMFEHDTKESQENRIEIKDVSAETYHELLRYIYTDKVEKLEENALELMVAADKYQLDHLKSICEQYLGANLTIESVALTLVMADMHRAKALKAKCIEYICTNARKVKATEGWKTLAAKTELLTELFLYVSDKYSE